MKCNSKN